MRARRRWVLPVGLILGALVLLGAWAGWQAWAVNRDLNSAVDDASALQAAVLAQDTAAQQEELGRLQEHSSAAADRTDGLTWSVLERLPVVGDDANGVAVASSVVADLAQDGIEPLLQVTGQMDSLLPRDAAISVTAAERLQQPVATGDAAFATAERRLAAQDPSLFTPALREKYRDLTTKVQDAHDVLSASSTALDLLPTMLGGDGPRHYLLVFQNNAEIRATGGLPGAVSLVTADDGKVEMTRQVAASSFGERSSPVLPLAPEERQIYGEQLGTYFLDANFTPDFPRTADLMRARWEEVYGDKIDGVISIDPVALSYLLKATGPVSVGDTQLTSDNVVDQLLHQVYVNHSDPDAQDAYFRRVARAVFDKVSHGAENPISLARALGRAAREHRIYIHSFRADEQRQLTTTSVAGNLTDDHATGPQVGVFLNDGTGSKMSYYLRYDVQTLATYCTGTKQGLSATATLESRAPQDAASLPLYITGGGRHGIDPGTQLVFVRVYGPVDGDISGLLVDGRPARDASVLPQDGRPVVTVPVTLAPGQKVDLSWRMTSGPHQSGDTTTTVTPGIEESTTSSTTVSACAS